MSHTLNLHTHRRPVRAQRGMSLVELMVGITVGLFIVAAAATLMSSQLIENRKLLLETQVQQDLRASMDIITRQLRRAGAQAIDEAQTGLALAGSGTGGASNVRAGLTPDTGVGSEINFQFYRNASDTGPYGFKLEGGVIKTIVGATPQDLTDGDTLEVTAFSVTRNDVASTKLPCPNVCTGPDPTACWPDLVVRELTVTITGRARRDHDVQRTLTSNVRLRNDWLRFADAALPVCPA